MRFCSLLAQSDNVIEILDSTGATVVKYIYDAWGNHDVLDYTDFGLGELNPIRYRSYYYDTETGLYYLQSRYYDPEVGRFISMDDINYLDPETIGGTNLYAYCLNNPVMYVDPTGTSWNSFVENTTNWIENNWTAVLGGALVVSSVLLAYKSISSAFLPSIISGGIFGGIFSFLISKATNSNVIYNTVTGSIIGALGGIAWRPAVLATTGFSLLGDRIIDNNNASMKALFKAFLIGTTAGFFNFAGNKMLSAMIVGEPLMLYKIIAGGLSSFIFSSYNFVADMIVNLFI